MALPDEQIFDALVWIMSRCKLVVEGAAAAPVAALLGGLVKLPPGSKVVCVLSGGNVDLVSSRDGNGTDRVHALGNSRRHLRARHPSIDVRRADAGGDARVDGVVERVGFVAKPEAVAEQHRG